MINRVLIRVRIIQVLYAVYQNQDGSLKKAESELNYSFQKSYDLYFFFLLLIVELTESYAKRIEAGKAKLLPTDRDVNPNTKLLNNKFVRQLRENEILTSYLAERPMSWLEHEGELKHLLNDILESDLYKKYISDPHSDYEKDKEFWRNIFKNNICADENLEALLEDECLFWNDDIDTIESFVLKTIKKFDEKNGKAQPLLPMFRDEEDREFAIKLLRETMLHVKEYRDMITAYAKNWESERIAFMDLIIMQTAITELLNFPSIPVNVTLNEYIDIAKAYSTEKSASFINGILDSIVNKLREEKKMIK
ncbi:transcription antitermination factor NusB [Viscerimonas tarda]